MIDMPVTRPYLLLYFKTKQLH